MGFFTSDAEGVLWWYTLGWFISYLSFMFYYMYVGVAYTWFGEFNHYNKKCRTRQWLIKYGLVISPKDEDIYLTAALRAFFWPVRFPIFIVRVLLVHCLYNPTPPPCDCETVMATEIV